MECEEREQPRLGKHVRTAPNSPPPSPANEDLPTKRYLSSLSCQSRSLSSLLWWRGVAFSSCLYREVIRSWRPCYLSCLPRVKGVACWTYLFQQDRSVFIAVLSGFTAFLEAEIELIEGVEGGGVIIILHGELPSHSFTNKRTSTGWVCVRYSRLSLPTSDEAESEIKQMEVEGVFIIRHGGHPRDTNK
ncbi:hypothetical protein BaRGS_00035057 [Batillaria attramentaria]|uniref:SHSP domain-containing protein n=1 Tax=Batillaria attramentaria TaxID=370345 RepID=A0ABD0JFG2_9CAEN